MGLRPVADGHAVLSTQPQELPHHGRNSLVGELEIHREQTRVVDLRDKGGRTLVHLGFRLNPLFGDNEAEL